MSKLRIYLDSPFVKAKGWRALAFLENWAKKSKIPYNPTEGTKLDRLVKLYQYYKPTMPRGGRAFLIIARETRGLRQQQSIYRDALSHLGAPGFPKPKPKKTNGLVGDLYFFTVSHGAPQPAYVMVQGVRYNHVDANVYRRAITPSNAALGAGGQPLYGNAPSIVSTTTTSTPAVFLDLPGFQP